VAPQSAGGGGGNSKSCGHLLRTQPHYFSRSRRRGQGACGAARKPASGSRTAEVSPATGVEGGIQAKADVATEDIGLQQLFPGSSSFFAECQGRRERVRAAM